MVVPFGSARERRSRTLYRPTVSPSRSTHVDTVTGITSSLSCAAFGTLAAVAGVRTRLNGTSSEPATAPHPKLLD
jgi:hypothetical protein